MRNVRAPTRRRRSDSLLARLALFLLQLARAGEEVVDFATNGMDLGLELFGLLDAAADFANVFGMFAHVRRDFSTRYAESLLAKDAVVTGGGSGVGILQCDHSTCAGEGRRDWRPDRIKESVFVFERVADSRNAGEGDRKHASFEAGAGNRRRNEHHKLPGGAVGRTGGVAHHEIITARLARLHVAERNEICGGGGYVGAVEKPLVTERRAAIGAGLEADGAAGQDNLIRRLQCDGRRDQYN